MEYINSINQGNLLYIIAKANGIDFTVVAPVGNIEEKSKKGL